MALPGHSIQSWQAGRRPPHIRGIKCCQQSILPVLWSEEASCPQGGLGPWASSRWSGMEVLLQLETLQKTAHLLSLRVLPWRRDRGPPGRGFSELFMKHLH